MLRIIFFINLMWLSACFSPSLAPVEELRPQFAMNHPEHYHIVRQGDTLFAIAFLYNQNTEDLEKINHLSKPYVLKVGQRLQLRRGERALPVRKLEFFKPWSKWVWPTPTSQFKAFKQNKGITIPGQYQQPIYAAASGVVAYAGQGIPGYGNLILIKHSNHLLTAYAYNANISVVEGQRVKKGQIIAKMGYMKQHMAALHFEIRFQGQAQDPMRYFR